MPEAELERLTVTLLKLRLCGHPGRQVFVKTLKARGADERMLAVAQQLKCPECLESQLRKPASRVSLETEQVLFRTVQMDGFQFKYGTTVHHFLLFLDEASSFAVVTEMVNHPSAQEANMDTESVIQALEGAWIQYFGQPARIRCDPEGAFRGRGVEIFCAERGIELPHVPAEHHEATGAVERAIGSLRLRMEKFLRGKPGSPKRAAIAMVAAHNHVTRVGGYAPSQWVFGRSAEDVENLAHLSVQGQEGHTTADNLALRLRAEGRLKKLQAKAKISRAVNTRTTPSV